MQRDENKLEGKREEHTTRKLEMCVQLLSTVVPASLKIRAIIMSRCAGKRVLTARDAIRMALAYRWKALARRSQTTLRGSLPALVLICWPAWTSGVGAHFVHVRGRGRRRNVHV